MGKIREILNGWKNVVWEKPEVEKLAYDRLTICSTCDKNISNKCSECGCPLVAKLRSEYSKCPLGKW